MRIEELGPLYIGGRVCASGPFSDALRRAPLKQHRRQDYDHTHTLFELPSHHYTAQSFDWA